MEPTPRLVDYPYVTVRFRCQHCKRRGQQRLARLAERFGADCTLDELLDIISASCPVPRRPPPGRKARKYAIYCGIYLPDFEYRPRPPDQPGQPLRLVKDDAA